MLYRLSVHRPTAIVSVLFELKVGIRSRVLIAYIIALVQSSVNTSNGKRCITAHKDSERNSDVQMSGLYNDILP